MALGFIYHIRFSVFWAWPWAAFWAWPWAHIPYTVLCLLGMALGFMLTGPGPGLNFFVTDIEMVVGQDPPGVYLDS